MSSRGHVDEVFWPVGFAQFWDAYPRRVAKREAQLAWSQLQPTPAMLEVMLSSLSWQRTQPGWLKQGGQFIPYPATWLRGRRFEDEPFDPPAEDEPSWQELTDARDVRNRVWGGCRHDPRCGNSQACLLAIVQEQRDKRRAS